MMWLQRSMALSGELKVLVQKQATVHEDSKALVIWIPNRAAMNNIDVIVVITASALKCGNCHYR